MSHISSRSYRRGPDGGLIIASRYEGRRSRRLFGAFWAFVALILCMFPTVDVSAASRSTICAPDPALGFVEFSDRATDTTLLCGGTLVDNGEWVLTSADCADGFTDPTALADYGWGPSTERPDGYRQVIETYLHPEWTGDANRDLALLRLASPVEGVVTYNLALPPAETAVARIQTYASPAGLKCGLTVIESNVDGAIEYNTITSTGSPGSGLVSGRDLLAVTSRHSTRTQRLGSTYATALTDDVVEWITGTMLVSDRGMYGGNP